MGLPVDLPRVPMVMPRHDKTHTEQRAADRRRVQQASRLQAVRGHARIV